jgi:quaternary ammonium compound-resistance protein SugE
VPDGVASLGVDPLLRIPGRGVPYPERDKTAREGSVMAWLVLVISGVLEAVWATALGRSEGLTRVAPTVVFAVGLVLSMAGLAYSMRTLPSGTSYVVWVGIGATLTVVYAMLTGQESVSLLKALFLVLIIGGVVGLKLLH